MIGKEQLLRNVCNDIIDFFDKDNKPDIPFLMAVIGETGCGKTLFARCIVDLLKRSKDFIKDGLMGSDYTPIICTSLNAES
jgi:DNA-binding NtrC family response regulator